MPRESQITYTFKDTVPRSSAFTPTVTSVGTYFRLSVADSAAKPGTAIYVAAQTQVRKIAFMINATEGHLEGAFGSDLTAATVRIVPQQDAKLLKWSAAPETEEDSIVYNGVTMPVGVGINKEAPQTDQTSGGNLLEVPILDGTASDVFVIYTLF